MSAEELHQHATDDHRRSGSLLSPFELSQVYRCHLSTDRTPCKTAGDGHAQRMAHLALRLEGGSAGTGMLTYREGKAGGEVGLPEAWAIHLERLCASEELPGCGCWPEGEGQPLWDSAEMHYSHRNASRLFPSAAISWANVSLLRDAAQATHVRWHCRAYLTSKVRSTAPSSRKPRSSCAAAEAT